MFNLLTECIEEGARGFLWNDVSLHLKDQDDCEYYVGKLTNRIQVALEERFTFDDEIRG